ncbi:MAG: hypothetical protein Q9195_001892 [Heterodermia aff. obscurata]
MSAPLGTVLNDLAHERKVQSTGSFDSEELINVIVGHPPTSFKVNKDRICVLSGYINDAISSHKPKEPGTELGRLTMCMPEEKPLSFEIILNWTITDTFVDPETEAVYYYTRILDAYFLAQRLGMPVVCYAILKELHDRAPEGLMDCHGLIYTNTVPGSPLRRMLVGMAVNDSRVAGVFQKGPLYGIHNPDYVFDLKNELVEKLRSSRPPPNHTQRQ